MQKREANFTPLFESWMRNVRKETCAWELKVVKKENNSFPFSRLEKHQESWLKTVSNGTAVYKISDESIGSKPFDGFTFNGAPAYVVILFQKSKTFYMIHINNYVFYRDNKTKSKSLYEEDAEKIATVSVKLK